MNYSALILIISLFFALPVHAQISIESVSTDTINILNQKQNYSKPPKVAFFSTLLFPGSGHQIVGYRLRALSFVTIDLLSLFGTIYFSQHSHKIEKNYRAFASFHASISSQQNDDYYWQIVGNFNNYHDYHQTLDLIREKDSKFIKEIYFWQWEDESFRKEFIKMQKSAKKFTTVSSFFIGAMILNRIVAFIDIRSSIKNKKFSNTSISIKPIYHNSSIAEITISTLF